MDIPKGDTEQTFCSSEDDEFKCPNCGIDISGIIFDNNYFTPTGGGPPVTVGGFIQEGWIEGVQRCDCGHEWEISG